MTQLALNGTDSPVDPGFQTWNELLTDLESKKLTVDEVISSVYFDGDEVLNFRRDDALHTQLDSLREIRIESVGRNVMLRGAIQEADTYLASLKNSMIGVAELFRSDRLDQANPKLQQLFEGIKMFVALLRGIELSLSEPSASPESAVAKALEKMGTALEEQIKAQTEKDWMLLADILEYDLAPSLLSFEEILDGFKSQVGLK